MKKSEIPLLITSSLLSYAAKSSKLVSYNERAFQTVDALNKIINFNIFTKIVIVDGSNFKIFTDTEIDLFKESGTTIEQISFQQNIDDVREFGKSFGEVQIVNFAVLNSILIKESNNFFKISGRYSIENLDKIVPKLLKTTNVFFYETPLFLNKNREFISTIFYKTSVPFYNKYLKTAYDECNYSVSGYLESVYYRRLNGVKKTSLKVQFPIFDAISGTTGKKSKTNYLVFRKVLCKIGCLCFSFTDIN